MLIVESKNFLTSSNLIYSDGIFKWTSDVPDSAIIAGPGPRSFFEVAKIFGHEINPFISSKYYDSASLLDTEPPWCLYIGKQKFQTMIDNYVQSYNSFKQSVNLENLEIQSKIAYFVDSMSPAKYDIAKIDKEKLEKHLDRFILPYYKEGLLQRPTYTRIKTKTGRLSVTSGPNVLTMHSELRKGLTNGYSIDFVSIEPNVLLVSQGRKPRTDIYDNIKSEVFNDKISRAKVKIATMADLYGSGRSDKFAKGIEEYFAIDKKINDLTKLVVDDSIKNMFGRVINLGGATGKHLLALWLQSSAADAALYGFYNFYKQNDIVPHWIIHDGLIFIYKGDQRKIEYLDAGLSAKLPVKVEKLC